MAIVRPLLLLAALGATFAATASAKPAPAPGSVTLNQTAPAHRDTATFAYSLPPASKGDVCGPNPYTRVCATIQLACYQGAALVFNQVLPAAGNSFYLESGTYPDGTPFWPEGGASCKAALGDYGPKGNSIQWTVWATTSFAVTA